MVPFYSHGSNFLASPLGGDVEKIGDFQRRNTFTGSIFLAPPLGGDVEKLNDFQERKIRSHGTFFARGETSHAWLGNFVSRHATRLS